MCVNAHVFVSFFSICMCVIDKLCTAYCTHTWTCMDSSSSWLSKHVTGWLSTVMDVCVCFRCLPRKNRTMSMSKHLAAFFFLSLFHIDLKFLHQFLCLSLILAIADIDKQINLTSWLWHFFFFSFSCIILSCFANDLFLKRVKQHDYRHVLSTPLADNNNLQCHLWPPTVSLSPLVPQ